MFLDVFWRAYHGRRSGYAGKGHYCSASQLRIIRKAFNGRRYGKRRGRRSTPRRLSTLVKLFVVLRNIMTMTKYHRYSEVGKYYMRNSRHGRGDRRGSQYAQRDFSRVRSRAMRVTTIRVLNSGVHLIDRLRSRKMIARRGRTNRYETRTGRVTTRGHLTCHSTAKGTTGRRQHDRAPGRPMNPMVGNPILKRIKNARQINGNKGISRVLRRPSRQKGANFSGVPNLTTGRRSGNGRPGRGVSTSVNRFTSALRTVRREMDVRNTDSRRSSGVSSHTASDGVR